MPWDHQDPDKTPLYLAVKAGHVSTVTALLLNGAGVNIARVSGMSDVWHTGDSVGAWSPPILWCDRQ